MKIRVTLKKSFIGRNENHRRILRSLGLKKINQSVLHNDTPSIRGMIDKVIHMVEVNKAGSRAEPVPKTATGENEAGTSEA